MCDLFGLHISRCALPRRFGAINVLQCCWKVGKGAHPTLPSALRGNGLAVIETEKFDAYPVALTTLTLRKSWAAAAEAMDNPTRLKIRPPTFLRPPGDVAPVLFQLFRQNSADNLCH
jgi:hypothetical protein